MDFKEYIIVEQSKIPQELLNRIFNQKTKSAKYTVINQKLKYKKVAQQVKEIVQDKDLVVSLLTRVSSLEVLKGLLEKKDYLYIDAAIEDQYEEGSVSTIELEKLIKDFGNTHKPNSTILVDGGANPGLITHFMIMGLKQMARDAIQKKVSDYKQIEEFLNTNQIAQLAKILQVHTVHVSEREQMEVEDPSKFEGIFTNSWAPLDFLEEYTINGEISLGQNDREFFIKNKYQIIDDPQPTQGVLPFPFHIKTSSPFETFTGRVVKHPENVEIAEMLSTEDHTVTATFVYKPSKMVRKQFYKYNNIESMPFKAFSEELDGPLRGYELMGATIITAREDLHNRWFGSFVTCEDTRNTQIFTNPTVLQVAAGFYSFLNLIIKNPHMGVIWPHSLNSEEVIELAKPYLGTIFDVKLSEKLSWKFEDLISTEEAMNNDF